MMKGEWYVMPNIMKRKLKGGSASFECIEVLRFYKLSNLKIITFLLINRNWYNNSNQLNWIINIQMVLNSYFIYTLHFSWAL